MNLGNPFRFNELRDYCELQEFKKSRVLKVQRPSKLGIGVLRMLH